MTPSLTPAAETPAADEAFMALALKEARAAAAEGEVPVGAILVVRGEVIARAHNLREALFDPSAHAELLAIREASRALSCWRLLDSTLYVTLEPCLMCMGAALLGRVERIVFGAMDPRGGAAGSLYNVSQDERLNHRIVLQPGVLEADCSAILKQFFRDLREKRREERLLARAKAVSTSEEL